MGSPKGSVAGKRATPALLGPLAPLLDTLGPEAQAEVREAVVSLAASVAHEINNPLGYALSNLTFVVDRLRAGDRSPESDAELLASLGEALDGVERVRRVVVHLVVSARVDSHAPRLVDVRAALDAAISISTQVAGFPTRLVRDYLAVAPVLVEEAELVRLLQAMLALVARPLGEVPVRLEARVAPEGRARVAIEVGPLDAEAALGPSLELARELGGELSIVETEARRIARLVLGAAVTSVRRRGVTPVSELVASKSRARVLVIDDEGLMTKVVERILSKDGLEVACFSNARIALEHLAVSTAPDLILCDLMMPEVTGMEFHERLEASNPGLARRVVFVTGGATTPRAHKFLQNVPNGRLAKPFSAAELRAIVREQLERR